MNITNVAVMGLEESLLASGYPMLERPYTEEEFNSHLLGLAFAQSEEFDCLMTNPHVKRACNLGKAKSGSGHDSMLKGIIVQYDLTCNHVMLPQFMRYHFHDIISSQSKMHRITKMDLKSCCGTRVIQEIIDICQEEIEVYKNMIENKDEFTNEEIQEQYEVIMENLPMGLELTMRVTTNYLQEKSIRGQRRNHRMGFWREYCKWQDTLPMFLKLIGEE